MWGNVEGDGENAKGKRDDGALVKNRGNNHCRKRYFQNAREKGVDD